MNKVFNYFGNTQDNLESLQTRFPDVQLRSVKQTHSSIIVESSANSATIEADGHFTMETNVGLLLRTADCVPLMIYAPDINCVMAIHAGWKGVAKRIFPEGLKVLKNLKCDFDQLVIHVGPHIQRNSFEIDLPVKTEISQSLLHKHNEADFTKYERSSGKYFIDLQKVLYLQGQEFKVPYPQWTFTTTDTKTTTEYHSHRRDAANAGRNLSFVALTAAL